MPVHSVSSFSKDDVVPREKSAWKLGYWPELDGLRAIAITAVVLWHCAPSTVAGGFFGVEVFFALSGFLITCLLLEDLAAHQRIRFGRFYLRRALRLYPGLILLVGLNFVGNRLFLSATPASEDLTASLSSLLYYSNWVKAFDLSKLGTLGHTWTLSIEEQFYLLWPVTLTALYRLTPRFGRLAISVGALAIGVWLYRAFSVGSPDRLQAGLDMRLDALLFGCAAALIHRGGFLAGKKRLMPFLALPSLAVILWWLLRSESWAQRNTVVWGSSLVPLATSLFILSIVSVKSSGLLAKALSSPPARVVGRISYGIYLFHFPLLFWMANAFLGKSGLLWIPAYLVACFGIAYVSFHFCELPFQRLKERRYSA